MENPDVPWLRNYESRSPKPFTTPPSPAAVFFMNFLRSKGVRTAGAKLADIGCGSGRDSVYFARNGFEVHAIDRDGAAMGGIDLHGVRAHCHSVTDSWMFEDAFFDFAIDVLCYSGVRDAGGRKTYASELMRTLKPGGYCLLCVPDGPRAVEELEKEFAGLTTAASGRADDCGTRVLSLILRR